MKYALVDWYAGFPERSVYTRLLEEALGTTLEPTRDPAQAAIVLVGAHGSRHRSPDFQSLHAAWKLFITGEPVDADFGYVHHALSFDPLDYAGRNFRFQHWLLDLHWYDDLPATLTRAETEELLDTNRPLRACAATVPTRKRRVVAVFNNPEQRRVAVFHTLAARGLVDGVGRPFGNGGPHEYRKKCELISQYAINQCLENRFHHGYYTEKVLHARAFGCIPLTWADAGIAMDFDPRGLVNLRDFTTLAAVADEIEALLRDDARIRALVDTPILTQRPSLAGVRAFLARAYEQFRRGEIPDLGAGLASGTTGAQGRPSLPRRLLRGVGRVIQRVGDGLVARAGRGA